MAMSAISAKRLAEGRAKLLSLAFDPALGTKVLTRFYEAMRDRDLEQMAVDIDTYGSPSNTEPSLYVTNPRTKHERSDVAHTGTWFHIRSEKTKHGDMPGILQQLGLLLEPETFEELTELQQEPRVLHKEGIHNLFGLETGNSAGVVLTWYSLHPVVREKLLAHVHEFSSQLSGASGVLEKLLKPMIPTVKRADFTGGYWKFGLHNFQTTERGDGVYSIEFVYNYWDKTWANAREQGRAGAELGRNHQRTRVVTGVPLPTIVAAMQGVTPAPGYVVDRKSYAESGNGAGEIQDSETKAMSVAAGGSTMLLRFRLTTPKRQGVRTYEWMNIPASDVTLLELSASTHHRDMGNFDYASYPQGWELDDFSTTDHYNTLYTVRITAADPNSSEWDGGTYGTYGPFPHKIPVTDQVSGQLLGFQLYATAYRVSVGASSAADFAQNGSAAMVTAIVALLQVAQEKVHFIQGDSRGSFGRWRGDAKWYCEYQSL